MPTAKHCIVREACFQTHGSPEAAVDEALRQLRVEALDIVKGWGRPFKPEMHFKLELVRPVVATCNYSGETDKGKRTCGQESGKSATNNCPCTCHTVFKICPAVPEGSTAS